MANEIQERLNRIKEIVKQENFLANKGLGNEIGFYIFDYVPEDELIVREGVQLNISSLEKSGVIVQEIDIFELVIEILEDKNLLDKVIKIETKQGSEKMLSKLKPMIKKEKVAASITSKVRVETEVVFLTGVGKVYPLIRSHEILNNLHAYLDDKPLVVFFPGTYDMQALTLFDRLADNNYYRAFKLVP